MRWSLLLLTLLPSIIFINAGALGDEASIRPEKQTAATVVAQLADSAKKRTKSNSHNILHFGVHVSAMGKLDPHFAAGSQDRAFADMVFNGLLRYEPGNAPQIEPDLAVNIPEFEMIGGRQIWTLKLRKGVLFHPGPMTPAYEMTADDVVFSLNKSADKNYSAYAGEYAGMMVEKVDQYTIKIILDQPLSPILFLPKLTNYAGGFIVSKNAVQTMGYKGFTAHPIGTGPFMVKRHAPGKKLALISHERYFRGRPLLDGVEFHFLPSTEDREAALLKGTVDVIIASGDKQWLERMDKVDDVVIDNHGVGEVITIYFNTRMEPLTDIRVRKAMAYALDRNAFLNTTSRGHTGLVYSPVPADFLPGGLEKADVERLGLAYALDLKKAKELLAQAGHPDGFTLDLVTSEKRLYRTCYEAMREQLANVGIKCNIKVLTHSEMHKFIRQTPGPVVIYTAWRPNADVYLTRFFHSDSIIVTGAKPDTNFSHYSKIDKLIEDARLKIDPDQQISLWGQAQIRILNDMVAFPVMYAKQLYARRHHVDYGHDLISTMALYPQFTEKTKLMNRE